MKAMGRVAETTSSTDSDVLRVYVRYKEYLGAQQLAKMLNDLDEVYAVVHRGTFPEHPLTNDAMMRVEKCQTGESIEIVLIDGLREMLSSKASMLDATAAIGVVSVMGRFLINAGKAFAEARKKWYEGSKAREEALKLINERVALEAAGRKEDPLARLPSASRYEVWARVLRFMNFLEREDNITDVNVNGVSVVSKNGTRPR